MSIKKNRSAREVLLELGATPVTFGSILKSHRHNEEKTLAELSEILKISVSHLSDIEHGRKFVSIERAKEFAKRLKTSEEYFILVSIRDQLRKANCHYDVQLKAM
jgi:transcriptional regulator with XRE-family HTH domain